MDEYQKQIARGKELIHIRKEARYNRENRRPPIYLGTELIKSQFGKRYQKS